MSTNEQFFSIGQVAKLCNTPVKTLRYYDKIGLLKPESRDDVSNYRRYSKEQMNKLLVIRRMRALDFSINDIQNLMENTGLEFIEEMMVAKREQLLEETKILKAKQQVIDSLLHRIRLGRNIIANHPNPNDSHMDEPDINVEYLPQSRMLYTRQIMKQYHNADISFVRWIDILERCTALGIAINSPIIVTFHGELLEQFLMNDCDVEFGVLIEKDSVVPETENVRTWGDTYAASIYHIGKYSEIVRSYITLIQWINQHDCKISGPPCEQFIISPLEVELSDENRHIVQILIPIEKPADEL